MASAPIGETQKPQPTGQKHWITAWFAPSLKNIIGWALLVLLVCSGTKEIQYLKHIHGQSDGIQGEFVPYPGLNSLEWQATIGARKYTWTPPFPRVEAIRYLFGDSVTQLRVNYGLVILWLLIVNSVAALLSKGVRSLWKVWNNKQRILASFVLWIPVALIGGLLGCYSTFGYLATKPALPSVVGKFERVERIVFFDIVRKNGLLSVKADKPKPLDALWNEKIAANSIQAKGLERLLIPLHNRGILPPQSSDLLFDCPLILGAASYTRLPVDWTTDGFRKFCSSGVMIFGADQGGIRFAMLGIVFPNQATGISQIVEIGFERQLSASDWTEVSREHYSIGTEFGSNPWMSFFATWLGIGYATIAICWIAVFGFNQETKT